MNAILKVEDPKRYEVYNFKSSSFVELLSDTCFDIQMQYPILGMKHALEKCYVRKEVFEMLKNAAEKLPEGYKFRILDAWRPFDLQEELYETYSATIIHDFKLEKCDEKQKRAIISRFVSEPVADRSVPPVHTTGGAIDLTIVDANGKELEMGTAFDAFTDLTYTAAFEDKGDNEIKENRRLLYHIMTESGFTNLPSEWWHYDYGDRFWAYYNNKPAIYNGVFGREDLYVQ